MATKLNLRYCQVLHDSTYYDVIVGVNDLDEVNDILQEWALTSDGPAEALDLPTELILNENAENVNLTSKALNENVYVKSAVSGYSGFTRFAGVSGTFPTLPKVLVGDVYVMPEITAFLYSNTVFSGVFAEYTIATASFTLVENQVNYIGVKYVAGAPVYALYTDKASFDYSSIIPVSAVFYFDGELNVVPYGQAAYGLAEKLIDVQDKRAEFEITDNFTIVTGGTGIAVELSALKVSKGTDEIDCLVMNTVTADNDMWLWYKDSVSAWQKSESDNINNTQYQGTGLQTLGSGKFVINYIYRVIDDANLLIFNVLSGSFDSLALAKDSDMITDLPDAIKEGAVLVGRIIVEKDSLTPTVQKIQRVSPFATVV